MWFDYLLFNPGMFPTDRSKVLQDELRGLCFSRSGLTTDDDTLVLPESSHMCVRIVADCEYMRWQLSDLTLFV